MNFKNIKINSIYLKSIVSNKLKKKQIEKICLLKNQEWSFGLNSQLKWFNMYVKKNDLHNLLYINSKLVGYTLLRKRTCQINKLNRQSQYFLFDTLIIDKNYRKLKLSNLLMIFNNIIIKKAKICSVLNCNNSLINFYKKNHWKKLNKKSFKIVDAQFSSNTMIFNNFKKNTKYSFYTNK